MASRELSTLIAPLRDAAIKMQQTAKQNGYILLVYCTFRSFEEQARLYRQSRTITQIQKKGRQLVRAGYPELAAILDAVGPQYGTLRKHVTGAGPGESWHQYRRAFDAVPVVAGKAQWQNSSPYWQKYGLSAIMAGLEWAGNWNRFREFPHCQMFAPVSNPLKALSRPEIMMALMYNEQWLEENDEEQV